MFVKFSCAIFVWKYFHCTFKHRSCIVKLQLSYACWDILTKASKSASNNSLIDFPFWSVVYPVLCPKFTLIQPTWSAYPYHLVFLIWYPYSLVFLIWYPYAPTSFYGSTAHCSGYGVAMGCYGLFIVTRTAIVTSQWYDRYCFTEYARTWARHPTTPWQRECTAITDRQSIDSLLDSMRFVTHFW